MNRKAFVIITGGHLFFANPLCNLARKMNSTGAMNEFNCTLNAIKPQLDDMDVIGRTVPVIIEYTDDDCFGIEPVAVREIDEEMLIDATNAIWANMEANQCEQS